MPSLKMPVQRAVKFYDSLRTLSTVYGVDIANPSFRQMLVDDMWLASPVQLISAWDCLNYFDWPTDSEVQEIIDNEQRTRQYLEWVIEGRAS